ncbi:MAG: hypothetical protein ACREE2_20205 [Stellaceae bacterium]
MVPIAAFAALDAIEYVSAGDVRLAQSGVMIVAGIAGGALGIILANRLRPSRYAADIRGVHDHPAGLMPGPSAGHGRLMLADSR